MKRDQPDYRLPMALVDPSTGVILKLLNIELLPGFDSKTFTFEQLNQAVPGLLRYRTDGQRKAILAYLAEPHYQKGFIGRKLRSDYIIHVYGRMLQLYEDIRVSRLGNDNRRYIQITWRPEARYYQKEFYVPDAPNIVGPNGSFSRHLLKEIKRVSAEAYCKKLRMTRVLRETVELLCGGATSVDEMSRIRYRGESAIKEARRRLLQIGRDLEVPALDTPLKVALFLKRDGFS